MKNFLVLFIISSGVTSCTHIYYAPNTVNAPLLSEKKEMRLNTLYTSGNESEFKGGEIQFAYAFTDKWAFMVNGFSAGKEENTGTYNEEGKGSYVECAGGFFKPLDQKKKLIGEVYAGFGGGSIKNDYGMGDRSKVNHIKFFLQPAIGFKSKYFELAFSPKLSLINWKVKERRVLNHDNDGVNSDLGYIEANPVFFALEPGIIVRAGSKNLKLHLAMSFSRPANQLYDYLSLRENLNSSLGLSFNFNTSKK